MVPQVAQRDRLAQLDRRIGIAAPVDPGMDAMTEADVVGELVQLAVHGQWRLARWGRVGGGGRSVAGRHETQTGRTCCAFITRFVRSRKENPQFDW